MEDVQGLLGWVPPHLLRPWVRVIEVPLHRATVGQIRGPLDLCLRLADKLVYHEPWGIPQVAILPVMKDVDVYCTEALICPAHELPETREVVMHQEQLLDLRRILLTTTADESGGKSFQIQLREFLCEFLGEGLVPQSFKFSVPSDHLVDAWVVGLAILLPDPPAQPRVEAAEERAILPDESLTTICPSAATAEVLDRLQHGTHMSLRRTIACRSGGHDAEGGHGRQKKQGRHA
mmetsp:Transcript_70883/g.198789  ORF Transcript_70883/g.198789 Transcript_70883/m.198789 type:complete len:234 (-) Transcript_70883:3-704(-)